MRHHLSLDLHFHHSMFEMIDSRFIYEFNWICFFGNFLSLSIYKLIILIIEEFLLYHCNLKSCNLSLKLSYLFALKYWHFLFLVFLSQMKICLIEILYQYLFSPKFKNLIFLGFQFNEVLFIWNFCFYHYFFFQFFRF